MRKQFCKQCYARPACTEPCKIVAAELRQKGVYDQDPKTGALTHKGKEIALIFMYDPYTDEMQGLIDNEDGPEIIWE